MNMEKTYAGSDYTIADRMNDAPNMLNLDLYGLWDVVATGREGYGLRDHELRDYVHLYVKTLVSAGGIVIEVGPADRDRFWVAAARYGSLPHEVADTILSEWVAFGEPSLPPYEGIAFARPAFVDSEDNSRAWHRANRPPKIL